MDVWRAIAHLIEDINPDRLASFAESIARMESSAQLPDAAALLGPMANADAVRTLMAAWEGSPQVTPLEIAAGLRAGMRVRADVQEGQSLELVWTGPGTGLITTRQTEQVMLELVRSAQSELLWITYVFHKADAVIDAVAAATARGIDVRILVDARASWQGGQPDAPERLVEAVPRARVFTWGGASEAQASMHAKCSIADSDLAFVTSANLTSAALERNMELGVLIRGGTLPALLRSHFEALIATGVMKEWSPGARAPGPYTQGHA